MVFACGISSYSVTMFHLMNHAFFKGAPLCRIIGCLKDRSRSGRKTLSSRLDQTQCWKTNGQADRKSFIEISHTYSWFEEKLGCEEFRLTKWIQDWCQTKARILTYGLGESLFWVEECFESSFDLRKTDHLQTKDISCYKRTHRQGYYNITPMIGTTGYPKAPFGVLTSSYELGGYGGFVVLERNKDTLEEGIQSTSPQVKWEPKPTHGGYTKGSAFEQPIGAPNIFSLGKLYNLLARILEADTGIAPIRLAGEGLRRPGKGSPDTLYSLKIPGGSALLFKWQKQLLAGPYNLSPPPAKPGEGTCPLLDEDGAFNSAQRVQKRKGRPLGISSRVQIILAAIKNELERIYEPQFLNTSHGFRPHRGCHTALAQMASDFPSIQFIIRADLSKGFQNIAHENFIKILKKEISCPKLLALIAQCLKIGYSEIGTLHFNRGTPKASVLSPLLCNIFLHEFDKYIEELKVKHNKAKTKQSLTHKRPDWNNTVSPPPDSVGGRGDIPACPMEKSHDAEKMPNRSQEILTTPSITKDENFIRIRYVRYAYDFIIGIQGPYSLANQVQGEITECLQSFGLDCPLDKTHLTPSSWHKKPVNFLGYKIIAPKIPRGKKQSLPLGTPNPTRRNNPRIRFDIPIRDLLNKLQRNQFLKVGKNPHGTRTEIFRGTFKGNLINLEHKDIIRSYNSIITSIWNYYSFANNIRELGRIYSLLRESCALTLARKYKLRSQKQVFRKYGQNLRKDKIELIKPHVKINAKRNFHRISQRGPLGPKIRTHE